MGGFGGGKRMRVLDVKGRFGRRTSTQHGPNGFEDDTSAPRHCFVHIRSRLEDEVEVSSIDR